MFEKNKSYTREEIYRVLGGGKQNFLLQKNGVVVGVCPNPKMNPEAPRVILLGSGPKVKQHGALLATQTNAVPLFLKKASSKWEYQGDFVVDSFITDTTKFSGYNLAGRTDVSGILLLK
jgi:hypothetical protein